MSRYKSDTNGLYDPTDSDDELDGFQKGRDKIQLNGADSDSEFEQDEAVLDLDEDEDEDEEEEDEEGAGGKKLAWLREQEKLMARKMKLQGGGSDDDEAEEEGGERAKGDLEWGARKQKYYGADVADHEIMDREEDVLKEEAEETMRLQREQLNKFRPQDFGMDEEDEDESEKEDEENEEDQPLEKVAEKGGARQGAKQGKRGAEVEVVAKELEGLSTAERLQYVAQDAPELVALLDELRGSLDEVRGRVEPLLQEVKAGGLATQEGLSYLEAKHLLLLSYCTNIVFYLMLKADGTPVQDHPVIQRLLQIRSYIEKIRPIDKQLNYQIQKLLRAVEVAGKEAGAANGGDAEATDEGAVTRYGPKPDQLVSAEVAGPRDLADGAGAGVYRPPKLNPTSMEGDEGAGRVARKEERRMKEAKRKAARSSLVRELAAEIGGNPEEIRETAAGFESVAAIRQRQRLEARSAVEEDLFTRVPLSKEEAKKLKAQRRAGLSSRAVFDDFADEVDDLVEMSRGVDSQRQGGAGNSLTQLFQRHKVSQKYGADLEAEAAQARASGDRDVPMREPLHERRARYDAVAAKRTAKQNMEDFDVDGADDDFGAEEDGGRAGSKRGKRHREEDDFYQEAKGARLATKQARKDAHSVPDLLPPLLDETVAGPRKITTEIEKNRGLTPHRRKDLKNPRKKHRVNYSKALVRRKGQVQDVRTQDARYAGEKSGIKSKISKSRRFG